LSQTLIPRGPVPLNPRAAVRQAKLAAGHRRPANVGMSQDHARQVATPCSVRRARAERDDGTITAPPPARYHRIVLAILHTKEMLSAGFKQREVQQFCDETLVSELFPVKEVTNAPRSLERK
jgi:hypothetical protein